MGFKGLPPDVNLTSFSAESIFQMTDTLFKLCIKFFVNLDKEIEHVVKVGRGVVTPATSAFHVWVNLC